MADFTRIFGRNLWANTQSTNYIWDVTQLDYTYIYKTYQNKYQIKARLSTGITITLGQEDLEATALAVQSALMLAICNPDSYDRLLEYPYH